MALLLANPDCCCGSGDCNNVDEQVVDASKGIVTLVDVNCPPCNVGTIDDNLIFTGFAGGRWQWHTGTDCEVPPASPNTMDVSLECITGEVAESGQWEICVDSFSYFPESCDEISDATATGCILVNGNLITTGSALAFIGGPFTVGLTIVPVDPLCPNETCDVTVEFIEV